MSVDRRHALGLMAAATIVPALNPILAQAKIVQTPNPLIQPWSGPYGGVPPFDKARLDLFESAFDEAMATSRAEITAIVQNPEAPNFENTLLALELSGDAMNRIATVYFIWDSNLSSPQLQDISSRVLPKLSAFGDELTQNVALFKRIESVYTAREGAGLTSEQNRLLEETYKNFVRAGARQSKTTKAKIAGINQKLSSLYDRFGNNQLADESTYIELTRDDLDGLSEGFIAGLAQAAKGKGKDGLYLVKNTRSAMEPFTTFSTRRDLREKVWRAYIMRGENGGATDNMAIIADILKLRQQKALLQGYPTFAHLNMEGSMAKVPENAMALMESVWGAAVARVKEEVADMQALADSEGANITIAPWDYRYYAEKVRKAKYDLDENEIKPYMQLENLREGMFWAAGQNYGYSFEQIHDLPVFHEDVRTWRVKRGGKTIGVWYFDPYARDGKRSGAWMNAYREQSRPLGKDIITIVSNNSNFIKGAPAEPVLVSWDDAETLFHEFGHALHGLSANCTYASLSGTNVARDFVEFPSQINEHWLSTPEVLSKFALHYKTGEPMPLALLEKIKKAATFNQGFKTVEFLGSALIDMKLHLAAANGPIDPKKFEKEELDKLGMPKEIVMRHRTAHFGHIFSGDGYAAGYYAYLWADTLTADAWEAFLEGEGAYDKAVAARFYTEIMSVGNTRDQAESYRAFRGRDVDTKALMRDRGFI